MGRIAGRQVSRLLRALDDPSASEDLHLSALAEAQFARHMLNAGCTLEFEAPTPSGRSADFRVERDGISFYVHIKRLWVGNHEPARAMPDEFALIEQVERPLLLGVRWNSDATAGQRTRIANDMHEFATQASVGDELAVRDESGELLGSCRVLAPHAGTHVALRADYDTEEDAAIPRAQRVLRRAFSQFMPGALNVICVVGDGVASEHALETALLGSMVERWDLFPPRGKRVAHGRAHDGFWARGQFNGCDLVAWLPIDDHDATARVWVREDATVDRRAERIMRESLGASDARVEAARGDADSRARDEDPPR